MTRKLFALQFYFTLNTGQINSGYWHVTEHAFSFRVVEIASFLNQGLLFGKISVFVKHLQGSRHCSKHFTNINLLNSHNNPMKRYIYDPHFIGEETAERVTCLSLTQLQCNKAGIGIQAAADSSGVLCSAPSCLACLLSVSVFHKKLLVFP